MRRRILVVDDEPGMLRAVCRILEQRYDVEGVESGEQALSCAGRARPDLAIVASSAIHALVYTSYVWMVGRAGAVFAGQVSYLVTGFGVLWAMLVLGERYSGYVWLAMALMFVGLFLVRPRPRAALVMPDKAGQDGPEEQPVGGP